MRFDKPDPDRYRISDCGRYLVERIHVGADGYRYCVWQYNTQAGGYESMEAAVDAIMTRELHRWEAAANVGTVNYDELDRLRFRPRKALEGDLGL